jgi:hypothetical protein
MVNEKIGNGSFGWQHGSSLTQNDHGRVRKVQVNLCNPEILFYGHGG